MPLEVAPPMLVVSEVLPCTVVGDGPQAGNRCALVRLGGCNLACTWCDVPYAWDGSRYDVVHTLPRRLVRNIVAEALAEAPRLVVVSGGEPLLQQRSTGWTALLESLLTAGAEVEVHTNGTIVPTEATMMLAHRFVVSPKLSHSGEPAWTRINPEALAVWGSLAAADRAQFCVVVRDRTDVQTTASLATLHGVPHHAIWVSPEASVPSRLVQVTGEIAESAVQHGFNVATRVCVLARTARAAVA